MIMKQKHSGKVLMIVALTIILLVTACSNSTNENSTKSNEQVAAPSVKDETPVETPSEPKKVSITAFDRGQVSSDEGTYEKNRWVDWIREQSGIEVTMVPVPKSKAKDTINLLLASGQAPDLIWEYNRNYIGQLVTQGVLQPIDEYIEKYSTSYKEYLKANPELLPYLTFNGEMYAVSSKRSMNAIANHAMWIRQDWLDDVQLKTPTTMEELIVVAKAFKEKYPDSTPIVGPNGEDIYAALYGVNRALWYLEDGKMKYGATMDRYADAIALERELFANNLLDREYLTDTSGERAKQLWSTGKAGIYLGQWNIEGLLKDMLTNDPEAKPVPLETVSTKYGKYGPFQEAPPLVFTVFNKDMKDPQAAVEYLDWLVDKGWFTLKNGLEGTHHTMTDGIAKAIDGDKFTKEVAYAGEYAVLNQENIKPEDLPKRAAPDELSQQVANLMAGALQTALKNEFRRDIPFQPNFDEINEIRATFDTFASETRAMNTVQGDKHSDDWAITQIRNEWKRLGGEKAEEIANKWYEDNKASF